MRSIGEGTNGIVFKAKHVEIGEVIALNDAAGGPAAAGEWHP